MDISYPFIPKSNAKLKPGHFWPVKLSNGKYACGVVLAVPQGGTYSTRHFYVGLLDWVGDSKPTVDSLDSSRLKLLREGNVHIKTISIHNEAIEGCIDLVKNDLEIELVVECQVYDQYSNVLRGYEVVRKATRQDHETLQTKSTWGYDIITLYANKLLVGDGNSM